MIPRQLFFCLLAVGCLQAASHAAPLVDGPMGVERVARPTARNYSTPALTNHPAPVWVQVDLQRSLPVETVKLFPIVDWNWLGPIKTEGFPLRFKVEASDDPEFRTASLIADKTGADFPNTEDAVISFSGEGKAGRYVRLTATRLNGPKLMLMKIEVWSGGKNVAEGCAASDSLKGNLGATALTRTTRPQDEVVTDNPGNVLPVAQWKPVANRVQTPLGGVRLGDGLFKTAMQNNIGYLMSTMTKDEMVRYFRERAGQPNPPGLRKPSYFWDTMLVGQNAGRFLMGAGNTLRWMEDAALRQRMDEIVDVIAECRQPDGYLMAFPTNGIFLSERAAYTRAWLTHGLIEAGYGGNAKAFPLLRGFYDWFNQCAYLPELLRRPIQGQQGTVANTRVYFTPVGKPEDLQVVQRYLQEDYWLAGLAKRDLEAIWKYPYDRPHCYLLTAVEPYLDLYRATGDRKYLVAASNCWEMYRENWEQIGGAISIIEGRVAPPKSNKFRGTGELCGSVFMARLSQRFHLLYPDEEKYVEEIEKAIYNVTLPNQDGSNGILYHANLVGQKDGKEETCVGTCCEGQGTRMIGSLPEYIYSIAADGLYVDLFAASEITWQQNQQTLKLRMETRFPFDNKVSLRFSLAAPTASKIRVRVPSWAARAMPILVNGQPTATGAPGTYVALERTWKDGDTIAFDLPAELRVTPYTGVEAAPDSPRYAFQYGPVMLAAVGSGSDSAEAIFNGDGNSLLARLKPKPGAPLHFAIAGETNYSFIPYWEVPTRWNFTCLPTFNARGEDLPGRR